MSLFKTSPLGIEQYLSKFPERERVKARLVLDLADLLIGPTSGQNARELAKRACDQDPRAIAMAMKEAAERYLKGL